MPTDDRVARHVTIAAQHLKAAIQLIDENDALPRKASYFSNLNRAYTNLKGLANADKYRESR